jgi:hypothetical protein
VYLPGGGVQAPLRLASGRCDARCDHRELEDLMSETTGPVEMLAVSFDATTSFQGRIAEEIEKLEDAGLIRVLDFLFLQKERDSGSFVRVDYDGEGLVTRLMDEQTVGAAGGDALRLSGDDIRSVAAALEPGASAAFMVFEHLWSRGLHDAISEVGGELFIEGFLAPEVVRAAS